jgi:type I restriction enzyme S subunit
MSASWDQTCLDDVIEVVSGLVDPNEQPYAEWPHVGGDNIESHTGKLGVLKKSKDLGLISGKYAFGNEHVLYSKIRPNLNKVAVPDFEGVCSADMYPLKPRNGSITREFLAYLLRAAHFLDYALKHSTRTNIPKLNRKALLAYSFPLPPLAEQKRIAEILDAANALRAKRRESLAQLDTLLQSTFLDMFGDPITNPMEWEVVKTADVGSVQGGLQVTSKRRSLPIERPYLRVANVYRGHLDLGEIKTIRLTEAEERRTKLEAEDVLIVEGHGNKEEIGRCARWDGSVEQCVHQNHLIRLRCDRSRVLPLYFETYLNSEGGRRGLTGTSRTTSGLNTISVSKVKATLVALPPLDLQNRFAAIVESVEQQRASQRAHLAELDTLFASLQSRAFRGDL